MCRHGHEHAPRAPLRPWRPPGRTPPPGRHEPSNHRSAPEYSRSQASRRRQPPPRPPHAGWRRCPGLGPRHEPRPPRPAARAASACALARRPLRDMLCCTCSASAPAGRAQAGSVRRARHGVVWCRSGVCPRHGRHESVYLRVCGRPQLAAGRGRSFVRRSGLLAPNYKKFTKKKKKEKKETKKERKKKK